MQHPLNETDPRHELPGDSPNPQRSGLPYNDEEEDRWLTPTELWGVVILFAAVFWLAVLGAAFWAAFNNTGPSCPGKDPTWLGWCDEAPSRSGGSNQ